MSWLDKAEQQLGNQATTIRAIAALSPLVRKALDKNGIGLDDVLAVLRLVDRVFERIAGGFDGTITPDEAEKHIKEYADRLAAQDAEIDQKIADKFGGTP